MKKVIYFLVFIFVSCTVSLYCQEFHTPTEILLLINSSDITYNIDAVDEDDLEYTTYNLELVKHGTYRYKDKSGVIILDNFSNDYATDSDIWEDFNKAEKYFIKGYFSEARKYYKKIHKKIPENSQIITFIGQTYDLDKEYNKAVKWYKKAINANYFDYMAHWFLADVYYTKDKNKKALNEILIAHILNRNNPFLFDKMIDIIEDNELEYQEWIFLPGCTLKKKSKNKIILKYDEDESEWMMYLLCKALWVFEPGYREDMLYDTKEIAELIEEKECLSVMAMAYKTQSGNVPSKVKALNIYIKALENGKDSDYILYEIMLIKDPLLIYMMEQNKISDIVQYLKDHRIK